MRKNRFYWTIQCLIAALGDGLGLDHYLVTRLTRYRQYSDPLLEEKEEKSFDEVVSVCTQRIGVSREAIEREAAEVQRRYNAIVAEVSDKEAQDNGGPGEDDHGPH